MMATAVVVSLLLPNAFPLATKWARCSAPQLALSSSSSSSQRLPAKLKEWGCDAELWSKIRAKQVLINLADAGDETAVRERLAKLRNAPSITGIDDIPVLPQTLEAMGCDAALWAKVRSKAALVELAESGDEEAVRSRLAKLRATVADDEARAAATRERRKAKKEAKPSKWEKKFNRGGELLPEAIAARERSRRPRGDNPGRARPLRDGYSQAGPLPSSVDVGAVERLLAERVQAKLRKDFDEADALQAQLRSMGVRVNDRRRTYFDAKSDWS